MPILCTDAYKTQVERESDSIRRYKSPLSFCDSAVLFHIWGYVLWHYVKCARIMQTSFLVSWCEVRLNVYPIADATIGEMIMVGVHSLTSNIWYCWCLLRWRGYPRLQFLPCLCRDSTPVWPYWVGWCRGCLTCEAAFVLVWFSRWVTHSEGLVLITLA